MTISQDIKKGIFIALGVSVIIIASVVFYNKFKKPVDDTPQGFNQLIQRTSKDHPELLYWWESLTIEKQIQIENTMTPELLVILSKGLAKKNIPEDVKKLLAKAGYVE